jgi:DNA-binding NtrC family response regulator
MPTTVVFEKQPRWAPELERQFFTADARVVSCRSLPDVAQRMAAVPRGVVLLDASAATGECLQFLRGEMGDPEALPVVVVGNKRMAHLEWSFRELGAAAFFAKKIPGREMASICRRLWSHSSVARCDRLTASIQQQRSSHP